MKMADRRSTTCETFGKTVNGWKVGLGGGDRAFFNGDWLKRAAVAKGGIYANDALEAAYPSPATDDAADARRQSATTR